MKDTEKGTWRLTLTEKNGNPSRRYSIYCTADSKEAAIAYYEENFSRFNNLVRVTKKH